MICAVIKGPSLEEAYQQISQAIELADLIEIRLDLFTNRSVKELQDLRSQFSIPMIFTLRSQLQGGSYSQSEEDRLLEIRNLMILKPEYLDLENHVSSQVIEEISSQFPETKIILSYHNFSETPKDLEDIYQQMQKIRATYYKIAVTPKNSIDTLKLISLAKNANVIAISMGPTGQLSRIIGPILGSSITYVSLKEDLETAPGQISLETLINRYRYRFLNKNSALFGLIGNPVDKSLSDKSHNHVLAHFGLNAVYVKIPVLPEDLAEFFQFIKRLPFRGLSVTMPLKEHVLKHLDDIDDVAKEIGAVNTLLFDQGKMIGYNTDGIGALNAIEKKCRSVKGKKIVIIGAGGAAKAIAYVASQRGANVTIVNRNKENAEQIANQIHGTGKSLSEMPSCCDEGYDIIINCTPIPMPIPIHCILPNTIAMDIVSSPVETEFLQQAKKKGCTIVYGLEMFVEQAVGQFKIWFKDQIDEQKCRDLLNRFVLG